MKSVVLPVVLALALSLGCVPDSSESEVHTDHGRFQHLSPGGQHARWQVEPFRQIGVLLDTPSTRVEARIDGGEWQPVEITWEEGDHKVGRLLVDGEASSLELRADEPWTYGTVQFFDDVEASDVLARDLPVAQPNFHVAALAPAGMVVTRAQWGARNPNRACGSWHDPYRITIHHTFLPADDGNDPAARLRQIQAYHIDTRGWCDIGYHFVVSQSGKIFQGRSNEERTGAHSNNQNTGNIGINFIGDFDRQTVNSTQFAAGARILGWVARTYDVPFNRRSIRGHGDVAGQSTDCPGRNLRSRLDELIALAQQGGSVEPAQPTSSSPVVFEVNWRSEETDTYTAGSSAGTPDVLPGDWMRAEIKFKNTTSVPLRGVELGFEMEHLEPTNYVIESDAPSFNGVSFRTNDANDNPDNPPSDNLGKSGILGIYALAPGETKRVTIDFHAGEYSIGAVEHGLLRSWIRQINHHYGEQSGYDVEPTDNIFAGLLQDSAEVDILSGDEWQFDGGEATQLEGWRGCNGVSASVDPSRGTLVASTGAGQCLKSPAWTSIDADDWDQLVIRMNVSGNHTAALYWAHDGERLIDRRAVTFPVSANQDTYVLDLGAQPNWSGEITDLLIVPSLEQGTTAAIDAVFMQSSDGRVASVREHYQSGNLARLSNDAPMPRDVDDRADASEFVPADDADTSAPVGGCSSTSSNAPSGALLLLLAFGVMCRSARRQRIMRRLEV